MASRTFTINQDGSSRTFTVNTGVGPQGPAGTAGTTSWSGLTGEANYIPFDTTPTSVPTTLGTLSWNADDACLEYAVDGGTISIGKETFDYYTNLSGVTMVDGDIVSIVGATGNRTAVDLTDATDSTSAANVIGMVTQGAANNGTVRVTKTGNVHLLNTNGLTEGGSIYVDPADPGKWTMTRPTRPNHVISIGVVRVAHAVNGVVDVVPNHQCITSADIIDPVTQITENKEAVAHFWDQLADLELAAYPSDQKYVVLAGAGDSMGTDTGFMPYLIEDLVRKYGQGCVGTSGLMLSIGSGQYVMTTGGTGSTTSSDYTYLPNGEFFTIASGQTITETPNSANIHSGFRKIRCFYARKTGGGTLTFSVAQTGASITNKVVDTSTGTAGTIGYVDFEAADGLLMNNKPVLTVSSATATSHYIGCVMYLNSGVIPLRIGRGGSSCAQALTGAAANLSTLATAMDLRLVCFASKETDEDETLADLETLLDRWHTQVPDCSYVLVGATPSPSGESDVDPAQNTLLRSKGDEFGWVFVDGQKLFRSTAYLATIGTDADGWNESGGTGPHLATKARRFIATWILQNVLLGSRVAAGRFSPISMQASSRDYSNRTRLTFWTKTASNYNSSNFTQTSPDMGRFTFNYTASPAPVANSGLATQVGYPEIGLNLHSVLSYVITDGYLVDDVKAVVQCGGASQTELTTGMTDTNYSGFRIIHGVDTLSGQPTPYIQFAVKGSTTTETLSPKIYHSSSSGAAPFAGGTWRTSNAHLYTVEYIGNGSSTSKRFRAWHQPLSGASGETRIADRRMIADWTGTITAGGTFPNSIYLGLVTGASPATPGGARVIAFSDLEIVRPRDLTLIGNQDWNW